MKLIFISDTHGKHQQLELPKGDMLIHAGDVSRTGDLQEVTDFLKWFAALDFKHKIFVAGNHDFYFEPATEDELKYIIPENVIYLNDSGIEIDGIKIWGSPITPFFFNLAFNRQRGSDIKKHWELIPKETDILITHGPPHGILDETTRGEQVGCEELRNILRSLNLKFHVFGHIHEAYGVEEIDGTKYINASVLDFKYEMVNDAVSFLFEQDF